jgi:5'-nucleotidase
MNVLITNDDGIDAPGIQALEKLASEYGTPITFAPTQQLSGCGHQVTVDRAISVNEVSSNRFAVLGTPADCVRVAIASFDFNFEMVLSGINAGGNLGVDVFMSGTAAAAREASYFGIPSYSLSQYHKKGFASNWANSIKLARRGIEYVANKQVGEEGFWNINLPSLDTEVTEAANEVPVRVCRLDRKPHKISFERTENKFTYIGNYQSRHREPNSDVELCFGGAVTVSRA